MGASVTYAALISRGLLGVVFAVSAGSKLRSATAFRAFASWLGALPGLPALGRPMAAVLATAEAVTAVLLAVPWTGQAGLVLAAGLLALLAAGTFAVARTGVRTPCQCFGTSAAPLSARHVLRNVLLGAAAAIGAACPGPVAAGPAAVILCLDAGAFAALLVLFLDDLARFLAGPGPSAADGRPD